MGSVLNGQREKVDEEKGGKSDEDGEERSGDDDCNVMWKI